MAAVSAFSAHAFGAPIPGAVERLVAHATREVRVLSALAPVNAAEERERLTRALGSGIPVRPRWTYAPVAHCELRAALEAAEHVLEGSDDPLWLVYRARLAELRLEAELCAAAGTPDVARLGQQRFAPGTAAVAEEASALGHGWLAEAAPDRGDDVVASDGDDPRSLESRLRAEVGARRLPFSVVVRASLAPLAATGEGVILVAPGRRLSPVDVERTVVHEVEGHVLPRVRASERGVPLFRHGTARGVDHQEGRAILLEHRRGLLDVRRRRQLAARHWATRAMNDGAAFPDVAAALVRDHAVEPDEAVVMAERAFRGSDGVRAGLGRERIYLEAFLQVRAHLAEHPRDEALLASGQVGLDAIGALAALTP